jgi:hypothetical protein
MAFKIRANSPIRSDLGDSGEAFVEHAIGALERILPHTETSDWNLESGFEAPSANFADASKRELRLVMGLKLGAARWKIAGTLRRRRVPVGVGSIRRTIDLREKDLAFQVIRALTGTVGAKDPNRASSLTALRPGFDERVVAAHMVSYHNLRLDLGDVFATLRRLAEQTYENKSLAFGCVIEPRNSVKPLDSASFPRDFVERKRYRALSDGYRTAYRISGRGALLGFVELSARQTAGSQYYPEWCEDLAAASRKGRVALALTRQGDLLVLDNGHLTFTYRFGRWQYWNHSHLVDLIRNAARVQKVAHHQLSGVVRSIYRAALDVSFRRSGGLFVLLRRRKNLHRVVRGGDAIGDSARDSLDSTFDEALGTLRAQTMPRCLLAELAGLDGAVVLSNTGDILAHGAILDNQRKGKLQGSEGSRTKAAIGASHYGLAVKVSSDGDMTVFVGGEKFIDV